MASLIVNAGGQSRRMGRNKALMTLPSGETLLAQIIARLAPLVGPAGESSAIVVVANQPDLAHGARVREPVLVVGDSWPDAGALGGIATGLAHVSGWAMCVACDMPFVSPTLMRHLLALACATTGDIDAVVPVVGGRAQPFHAVYHARLTDALVRSIAGGTLRIADALPSTRTLWVDESTVRRVDPNLRAFFNVNTPEEWDAAVRLLAADL